MLAIIIHAAPYFIYSSHIVLFCSASQSVDILQQSLSDIGVEVVEKRFGSDEGISSISQLFVSLTGVYMLRPNSQPLKAGWGATNGCKFGQPALKRTTGFEAGRPAS